MESLKNNREFRRIYNRGKSYAGRAMVIYVMNNGLNVNRLGVSVSKKVGNSVVRNRARRRLKELYRVLEGTPELPQVGCGPWNPKSNAGADIVIIARPPIVSEDFQKLRAGFLSIMRKHAGAANG